MPYAAFESLVVLIVELGGVMAHVALTASLSTWFILDSLFCVIVGAWFNIYLINLPCLALLGILLLANVREIKEDT